MSLRHLEALADSVDPSVKAKGRMYAKVQGKQLAISDPVVRRGLIQMSMLEILQS